jgi:hypothetical protein
VELHSEKMFDNERIHSAVCLYRLVNDVRFTPSFALYAVSNDAEFSTKESAIKTVEAIILSQSEQFGPPDCKNATRQERCKAIWDEGTVLPNLSKVKLLTMKLEKWRNKKLADVMRLAGCRMEETTDKGRRDDVVNRK